MVALALALAAISGPVAGSAPAAATAPGGPPPAVTPTLPLAASIMSRATSGPVLSLTIACKGGSPGEACSGPIELTSDEMVRGGKVLAVTATEHSAKAAASRIEAVGSGSYSVPTGSSATVEITLNQTGQELLSRFYKLPATLTLGGTTSRTRMVSFRYPTIKSPISFTWAFTPSSTTALQLAISSVPPEGAVAVICHGGGCPFSTRRFTPSGGRVELAGAFKGKHLRPKTTVKLEITAPNRIGKVAVFTIQSGQQPSLVELCLPPGAAKPVRCV